LYLLVSVVFFCSSVIETIQVAQWFVTIPCIKWSALLETQPACLTFWFDSWWHN
jgi:hypothetical protein